MCISIYLRDFEVYNQSVEVAEKILGKYDVLRLQEMTSLEKVLLVENMW